VQLGFVIDHSRCIGCHACTVACKSENDVPLGNFRTWVKYTERGTFPEVRRSFAVLRCNQCSAAPCVEICPVSALAKRSDGIVDVDPAVCIGCKACMQGCPYDALYLNPSSGTAEKCHFCAHRVEQGLAPACAVVCPTEAIIPGDFHDPSSAVSRLRKEHDLTARKTEAGTGPNVLYREADNAGLDPAAAPATGGYLWSNQRPGPWQAAEAFLAEAEAKADGARTTYDVEHPALWRGKVSAYLLTKSIAAGAVPLLALAAFAGRAPRGFGVALAAVALVFLAATGALLVADLKRPERFWLILTRPNWSSWLARGTVVLAAYGALALAVLAGFAVSLPGAVRGAVLLFGAVGGAMAAAYTGWLFGQAKGRVLWMRRGLWFHLIVQALVAGASCAVFVAVAGGWMEPVGLLRWALGGALLVHLAFAVTEHRFSPAGREEEFRRAVSLVTHGPYARRRRLALVAGGVAPMILVALWPTGVGLVLASGLALAGLAVDEDVLVRAGQALPIS